MNPSQIPMPLDTVLFGVVCPGCNKNRIVYEGNYFCVGCGWALPDDHEKKMTKSLRNWYALAYTTLMYQRGDKPDAHVVSRIMREGY
jgi:hypothetical protein